MLHRAGWQIAQQLDLTAEYAAAIRRQLQEEENHAADLASWFGELEFAEQLDRRRALPRGRRRDSRAGRCSRPSRP
jgi:hypothetical protein